MACELPAKQGVPLSRWSAAELAREAVARGIVEQISGVTVWRWLSARTRSSPGSTAPGSSRATPASREKAGPILDLYAGRWQGERLHPGDYVICADEKPSIQARKRKAPTLPAARRRRPEGRARVRAQGRAVLPRRLGRPPRQDLRPLRPQGRHRAVRRARRAVHEPVEPYRSAQRVFVIVDNGSAHRGKRSIDRLQGAWPNLDPRPHPESTPHGSTKAEIYFSVAPAQGPHPQRLPRPRHARAAPARLRPPLRADRRPIPMEVHAPGPRTSSSAKADCAQPTHLAA